MYIFIVKLNYFDLKIFSIFSFKAVYHNKRLFRVKLYLRKDDTIYVTAIKFIDLLH